VLDDREVVTETSPHWIHDKPNVPASASPAIPVLLGAGYAFALAMGSVK
jgi:hypothetical protein